MAIDRRRTYVLDLAAVATLERTGTGLPPVGSCRREADLARLRRAYASARRPLAWRSPDAMLCRMRRVLGRMTPELAAGLRSALARPAEGFGWPLPPGMRYAGGIVVAGGRVRRDPEVFPPVD